ncbi:MAG TPA: beta-galactosidase family protein [Armatimonadota bacterium]|jgi:beta-galactosidase
MHGICHLIGFAACAGVALATPAVAAAPRVLSVDDKQFLMNGKPYLIISGEMHYPRIPRAYWRDRLRKARAMGLNTICTYVFWNLHEPRPGRFDFKNNLDVAAFVREAGEEGLNVILRPGPYVCSEWDFGGYPAWLLKDGTMKVRSRDPRFLDACARYLKRLARELARLQSSHGGPIVMVQVENEYGSYGSDHEFMEKNRQMIRDAGFEVQLFTADGPDQIPNGALDDLPAAFNFGGGAQSAVETVRKHRPTGPLMCGEYWCGWFDQWGVDHNAPAAGPKADDLEWMLSRGISVNLYMFHGGTNFGWMAGANDPPYLSDVTSYDYDSPLDEAGRATAKFTAFKAVIARHLPPGTVPPAMPAPQPVISITGIRLNRGVPLWDVLPAPVHSDQPRTMEDLGQSYGLVLYRTRLKAGASGDLAVRGLHGYATVFVNGRRIGALDRRTEVRSVKIEPVQAEATLDLLVENTGRVNYGASLPGERQGIVGSVTLGPETLSGWDAYSLPMDNVTGLKYGAIPASGPAFVRGSFALESVGDTFLDMRDWSKGNVWINGHNLGRFWRIGPQQTLYVPGPWLRKGSNDVIVFDAEYAGQTALGALPEPILDQRRD